VIILRSIVFNLLFYLNLGVLLIGAFVTLVLPRRAVLGMAKLWGRISVFLLRLVCGTRADVRGVKKLPPGPLLVAAKHQSTWETFALLHLFDDFTFIVKRELMWIPIFGWCMAKGGMVPVDRGGGSQALAAMGVRAREKVRAGRQLIIFPEGTRRPALRADRAELRAVLAAPRVSALSRHHRGRDSRPDSARSRQGCVHGAASGRDRGGDSAAGGGGQRRAQAAGACAGRVDLARSDSIKDGWTAGVGVETRLWASNWSARLEYLYMDLGKISFDAFCSLEAAQLFGLKPGRCEALTNSTSDHIIRVGINYRFGSRPR
jgi:1-acyl-sn-glycerol-3-phosphate acyltransferase